MAKSPTPSVSPKPKLTLRIGAGTLITFGLALIIGGYFVYQRHMEAARPPISEHHLLGTSLGAGIAPVPEFLLRHQGDLVLSTEQVKKITALAAAYRRDIAPTKTKADAAATEYQKYLERTKDAKRPAMVEIDAHGAEYRRLSSVLATVRHSYWKQARAILTPRQQQRVDTLVAKATLNDLR